MTHATPAIGVQTLSVAPPIPSTLVYPEDLRADAPEQRVRTPVKVDEIGSGEPVVFLHGLLGVNEHWYPVARSLAPRAKCVMLGMPLLELKGDTCSVDGVTKLTIAVLDAVVGGPSVIIGNSLGGHVAQRIAMERPDLCKALILAGSSGLFERTLERGVEHRPSHDWVTRKIKGLFCDEDRVPPDLIDRAFEELSQRHAARAVVRLGRSAKSDHMGDRIHTIQHPTLLLWGMQDAVTPPEVAEEFHELIPNSKLAWIDRCGHAPMIERPDEFAQAIHTFLDQLASGEFNGGQGRA
ncbi:MAG: alpha/beta fold hydrolase [Phycisphaerales bacterium]